MSKSGDAKGSHRIVLPVTAFMSGHDAKAGSQHAKTFGGLSSEELETRLAEFGSNVIAKVNG